MQITAANPYANVQHYVICTDCVAHTMQVRVNIRDRFRRMDPLYVQ